jgi:hypothetical protein
MRQLITTTWTSTMTVSQVSGTSGRTSVITWRSSEIRQASCGMRRRTSAILPRAVETWLLSTEIS